MVPGYTTYNWSGIDYQATEISQADSSIFTQPGRDVFGVKTDSTEAIGLIYFAGVKRTVHQFFGGYDHS
jgi:hypothetical protein